MPLDLAMFKLPHRGHATADPLPRFSPLTTSMNRFVAASPLALVYLDACVGKTVLH